MRENTKVQSAMELADQVASDPDLQEEVKADPAGALRRLAGPPLQTDVWIYRMVVMALGLVVLIAMGGTIYLANSANGVPDALISLGSAAVGALAGLLAPSPSKA